MRRLFQQFFLITLFKVTPQELPGQTVVLWISVAAAFVSGMAGLLFAYGFGDALGRSVLSLLVPAAFVYLLLRVRNQHHRFNQTFSAMCGSAAVIYVLAFPLMPYFFSAASDPQSGNWLIMLVLVIDIWALLITGFILKNALEIGFASGVSLSIALMIITMFVIRSVAPDSTILSPPAEPMAMLSTPSTSIVHTDTGVFLKL